jgi:hypothetical protein
LHDVPLQLQDGFYGSSLVLMIMMVRVRMVVTISLVVVRVVMTIISFVLMFMASGREVNVVFLLANFGDGYATGSLAAASTSTAHDDSFFAFKIS